MVVHLALSHAHRAVRRRPFDMHATCEALERLVLIEAQGDRHARALRRRLHGRLGHAAPTVTRQRAEAALATRQGVWLRTE